MVLQMIHIDWNIFGGTIMITKNFNHFRTNLEYIHVCLGTEPTQICILISNFLNHFLRPVLNIHMLHDTWTFRLSWLVYAMPTEDTVNLSPGKGNNRQILKSNLAQTVCNSLKSKKVLNMTFLLFKLLHTVCAKFDFRISLVICNFIILL